MRSLASAAVSPASHAGRAEGHPEGGWQVHEVQLMYLLRRDLPPIVLGCKLLNLPRCATCTRVFSEVERPYNVPCSCQHQGAFTLTPDLVELDTSVLEPLCEPCVYRSGSLSSSHSYVTHDATSVQKVPAVVF